MSVFGVDLGELTERLNALVATGGGRVADLRVLTGGASSLTFSARLTDAGDPVDVVVKVAPPGREPVGHRDVLRQARVLRALAEDGELPVPAVLFEEPGQPPPIPPLFVMRRVDGESIEPLFDVDAASSASTDEIAARAHHASRLLARIQASDTTQLDEPTTSLADEVERWARALATVPDAERLDWRALYAELSGTVPRALAPVIVHGDYRLGNMLARGASIAAVIDWELWALADPRLDLAWLRLNADPRAYGRSTRLGPLMPSPDELTETFDAACPADLAWFDALARLKATATWSLILKHAAGRPDPAYGWIGTVLPGLVRRGRELLAG